MSKPLSYYGYYVNERVDSNTLTTKNYIGVDNLMPNRGGVVDSEYVPIEGTSTAFKKGDLLIGNIRPYFKKIWLATFDGGCSPDVLCIRPNGKMISECLFAVLSQDTFFDYTMAGSKGSKMPRGDKNHIMAFPIPEVKGQEIIGNFTTNLYEKISINNKINTELESMANTLYEYWFLQFEFPNEEGRPYKSSGGRMVWSEELKREIPEGWETRQIGDILIESDKSKIQVNEAKEKGDFPFFTSGESILAYHEFLVDGFNIFLNTGGNPDIKAYKGKCAYSTDTWCVSAKQYSYILYHYLLKLMPQFEQLFFAGSGLKHLQKDALKSKLILIPDNKILKSFNLSCSSIWEKISNCSIQILELTSLRDFLLPILMNGQVTFK
ncbi:MAG: restriction endonuclease subunit S [Bacilli bacterium]